MPPRPTFHLESYAAEEADFARVLQTVQQLQTAPLAELRSLDWLHATVREAGLAMLDYAEIAYGEEMEWVNGSHQGIAQLPREFAGWLRLLADLEVKRYLEIGCYNGATATLATAYLRRFQPDFQAVTVDLAPTFLFHRQVRAILPVEYRVPVTSFALQEEEFDAVFIDGDHTFEWAWADYQNVGVRARVCGLHDIRSSHYFETNDLGGAPAVWALLQQQESGPGVEFHEFAEHPRGDIFGIGARVRHGT